MTERFEALGTALNGLMLLRRRVVSDERGYLDRLYAAEELTPLIGDGSVHQINLTMTRRRGTVRGMHFQHAPYAETKVVACIRGRVFDVAVDLRRDSPTFLRWHAEILEGRRSVSMLIPRGFAHGFQALSDDCELLYVHTAPYRADSEGGLNPLDPALGIEWPEQISAMSNRDRSQPLISPSFRGIET